MRKGMFDLSWLSITEETGNSRQASAILQLSGTHDAIHHDEELCNSDIHCFYEFIQCNRDFFFLSQKVVKRRMTFHNY